MEFYEGAFDASNPRKGGVFNAVPADHDVTDELAAYKLAGESFPGSFGIFYKVNKPTKNAKEAEINKILPHGKSQRPERLADRLQKKFSTG